VTLSAGFTTPFKLGAPDWNQVANVAAGTVQVGLGFAGTVCARADAPQPATEQQIAIAASRIRWCVIHVPCKNCRIAVSLGTAWMNDTVLPFAL